MCKRRSRSRHEFTDIAVDTSFVKAVVTRSDLIAAIIATSKSLGLIASTVVTRSDWPLYNRSFNLRFLVNHSCRYAERKTPGYQSTSPACLC